MKLSQSFLKTLRNVPKDETALNAKLLIRAGYIHKEMAGIYDFLPLGLRVMENIQNIVREELNAAGCEELLLSTLQRPDLWSKTKRWGKEGMDIWFTTDLAAGGELGLAPTHEEPITNLMKNYISSYKDLPVCAYQFQNKFRNELRSKSGILRTREFIMKDLYSFCPDRESHNQLYEKISDVYMKIYDRLGIGEDTYKTFASGGTFSKYSYEFQTITPVGEDVIWHNQDYSIVLNEEVFNDEVLADLGAKKNDFTSDNASEVGNIFTLGTKFSEPLDLKYTNQNGERLPVFMGCYGIGISRVMGVIVEKYADEKGIIWPEQIAPYKYYLIGIGEQAEQLATKLHDQNPELILLDDRDLHPGTKFNDAELIGIPKRIVISDKTLAEDSVEITDRKAGKSKSLTIEQLRSIL